MTSEWWQWLSGSLHWKWLAVGMTVISLAAALRSSSPGWFVAVLSGAAALFGWAVLSAILAPRTRPFWLSLAIVAGLHLALSFGPWTNERVGPQLFSVQAVNALAEWLEPRWRLQGKPSGEFIASILSSGKYPGGEGTGALPDAHFLRHWERGQASFFRICHMLSAFLLGAAVGISIQLWSVRHGPGAVKAAIEAV